MKSGLLLDIGIGKSTAVLELPAGENQTLLIGGDSFLVLDLLLQLFNGIRGLDLKGDGLASQSLDEDLHFHDLPLLMTDETIRLLFALYELNDCTIVTLVDRRIQIQHGDSLS